MKDKRLQKNSLGFWEVVNKPSNEELSNYYANKYYQSEASNYRKTYLAEELEMIRMKVSQRARKVEQLRGNSQPARVLDVGCGEGFAIAEFKKRGWQVEGIDYSIAGVVAMNPNLIEEIEQGDVFELLQKRINNRMLYDVVWLNNVLEHVNEPVILLKALRELIAENGVLVVTVPNDFSVLQETLLNERDIPERFWITLPDHISYFNTESLTNTAVATGWMCKDVQSDFPIDLYLAHEGSNYVCDKSQGKAAHFARIKIERLIGQRGEDAANYFYSALAGVGLGRNITAFLAPD